MPGKCTFQDEWLRSPLFKGWIMRDHKDEKRGVCRFCNKKIDVSSMGTSALRSHAKGDKHKKKAQITTGSSLTRYIAAASTSSSELESQPSAATPDASDISTIYVASTDAPRTVQTSQNLSTYLSKNDVLRAEIWWALKTVNSGYSFKSSEDIGFLWEKQFPDSEIANKATCGETKCMYLTCYGIAPFFRSLLQQKVRNEPYVLLFDESLNAGLQKKQLDFLVRFWDGRCVQSRYYTSDFLGQATAMDLMSSFHTHIDTLGFGNIVQLSMDGPNVNWSFYDKLESKIMEDCNRHLINVGSCGLHTLHNAFKTGMGSTGWEIPQILTSLYTVFHDTPARREDYEKVTTGSAGSGLYPMKFCNHRWLENTKPAQRAIDMIPSLTCFVEAVNLGKIKDPDTKSFNVLKKVLKDDLLKAKLAFFIVISKHLECFLQTYQTDKVMLPFLADDQGSLIRGLLRRVLKSSTISNADTVKKLTLTDIDNMENYLDAKEIDVGFVAEKLLKDLLSRKRISDRQAFEFRLQCRDCIKTIVSNIIRKAPIKYQLVRCLSCLDPRLLRKNPDVCIKRFKLVMQALVSANHVKEEEADEVVCQFQSFTSEIKSSEPFIDFDMNRDRLDHLYYESPNLRKTEYKKLWECIKVLLLLSHGQAVVERGFSMNKNVSVDNLSSEHLVDLRLVKDHLSSVGGLKDIQVSSGMLKYCVGARQRYHDDLRQKRESRKDEEKAKKRKTVTDELDELRVKQKRTKDQLDVLFKNAYTYFEKAENTGQIKFVANGNTLKRSAQEKEKQLTQIKKRV